MVERVKDEEDEEDDAEDEDCEPKLLFRCKPLELGVSANSVVARKRMLFMPRPALPRPALPRPALPWPVLPRPAIIDKLSN